MPRQVERQLHAGRQFCETLVDAELEVERAVLMPQHDRRRRPACRRRRASRSRTGRMRRAPAVARRTKAASPSSCTSAVPRLAFPAAGFQRQEHLDRGCDVRGRARHLETDLAVLGQPVALAAQLLQFLRPRARRAAILRRRAWRRGRRGDAIAAGAGACRPAQHFAESLAWRRHRARRRAGSAHGRRLRAPACINSSAASSAILAIEQRRAKRAVGIGADQRGQAGSCRRATSRSTGSSPIRRASDRRRSAAPAASAETPVRPRAEAFTANSQSGR